MITQSRIVGGVMFVTAVLISVTVLFAGQARGEFVAQYQVPISGNQEHFAILSWFKQIEMLEAVVNDLNGFVHVPQRIPINLVECSETNAFYDPRTHSIILCYEWIDEIKATFLNFYSVFGDYTTERKNLAILNTVVFTLHHEAGHALIAELNLPAVGREEDAVDQFAAIALTSSSHHLEKAVLDAGTFFKLESLNLVKKFFGRMISNSSYADVHGLDEQRFYNLTCLVYGKDPVEYSELINKLAGTRAESCQWEYAKAKSAWTRLLQSYLVAGALGSEAGVMRVEPPARVESAKSGTGTLTGQVLRALSDKKTVPVAETSVLAFQDTPGLPDCMVPVTAQVQMTTTDEHGVFLFDGLPAGSYQVCAVYEVEDPNTVRKMDVSIGKRVRVQSGDVARVTLKK